jgi:hypothetical protein
MLTALRPASNAQESTTNIKPLVSVEEVQERTALWLFSDVSYVSNVARAVATASQTLSAVHVKCAAKFKTILVSCSIENPCINYSLIHVHVKYHIMIRTIPMYCLCLFPYTCGMIV